MSRSNNSLPLANTPRGRKRAIFEPVEVGENALTFSARLLENWVMASQRSNRFPPINSKSLAASTPGVWVAVGKAVGIVGDWVGKAVRAGLFAGTSVADG